MKIIQKKSMGVMLVLLLLVIELASAAAETIEYRESDSDILNPDRGFYDPHQTSTSNFIPLVEAQLRARRINLYTPFRAEYQVRSTIILRHYVLDSFVASDDLSPDFLDAIQADFDIARNAGVRIMLRFSYTVTQNSGSCAVGFICPLYGDAPKSRVLAHIAQLSPVLKANSDVILGMQQGFIGTFGESYYTDFFGDASPNGQGYLNNQNWLDRNQVINALLNAIPSNRMLQIRYPQAKQRYVFGINASLNSQPLTRQDAFNGSDSARLGMHNDCLMASADDFGTFADYGNDASPVSQGNSSLLKAYARADSRYTLIGGETCSDAYSPQNNCEAQSGMAVATLEQNHYTFLNSDFNNEVNNDWNSGGCFDDIKQRLGYRLVLKTATMNGAAVTGQSFNVDLSIENQGFASPVNPRLLRLILRHQATGKEHKILLAGDNTNSQHWHSGASQVSATARLPEMPAGRYQTLLQIADPSNNQRIIDRPEYSIQFANIATWEPQTGYNDLMHVVDVTSDSEGSILDFLPAFIHAIKPVDQ